MSRKKHRDGLTLRGWIVLFIHWLGRTDPEVMAGCPAIDRFHMQAKAALLLAVAGIALFSWGAFLLLFFPWFIALPLLCPIMVWIVLLDQFMGSSHWRLQGILRTKTSQFAFSWVVIFGLIANNGTLALRLGIAAVTSSATALSATMAMNHATIEGQEERDRNEANAALRAAGEAEKQQIHRDMLTGDEAAMNAAAAERKALQQQIEMARENRENAAGAATDNQVGADCQLHGGRGSGCRSGPGPKYREALIRSQAANAAMSRAAADLAALEARLPDTENKYQDALKSYRAREVDYLKAAQVVDERVARDTVPARNDPAMAYRALQKVYASPDGEATRFFSHLMLTLLLTIELSYVLVSEYFGHASVYMTRLMARTRIHAAEATANYRRRLTELFGGEEGEPRLSYRVSPRFGTGD